MKQSTQKNRNAIIVLGMHRSGTSALTRVINILGVDLGPHLLQPNKHNQSGYWEHKDINLSNEALLKRLNSSWDDIRSLPGDWWNSDLAEAYELEIISILERDFSNSPFWGVKDPRICRLLPLWLPILEQTNSKPFFLIIVRNPLEVVASLAKRDGFSKGKSCLLWLKYLIESEKGTRNTSRIFTTYEELLTNWKGLSSRVEKTFGFKWPVRSEKASSEINAFLQDTLRHNRVTDTTLTKDKTLSKWVRDMYLALNRTIDGDDNQLIKTVNNIEAELKEAVGLYEPALTEIWEKYNAINTVIKEQRQQLADMHNQIEGLTRDKGSQLSSIDHLQSTIKEKDERIGQLGGELAVLRDQLSEIQQTLTIRETEATHLETGIKEKNEHIQQLDAELVLLREQLSEVQQTITGREAKIAHLETGIKERDERIQELDAELVLLREQLSEVQQTITGREAEIAHLETGIKERDDLIQQKDIDLKGLRNELASSQKDVLAREAQIANLQTSVKEKVQRIRQLEIRVNSLNTQLSEQNEKVEGLNTQLVERSNELFYLLNSNSWRFTRILRAIRRRLITIPNRLLRRYISNGARAIWHSLPVSAEGKLAFKNILFRTLPAFFKHTIAYHAWKTSNSAQATQVPTPSSQEKSQAVAQPETSDKKYHNDVSPLPLLDAYPLVDPPVRLIAFYLPQFHPIPENDEWWGKGFTEWVNVKRACPQFHGHYQPHVPGELGYYDLRDSKIQERQVELAKLYGIGGFCFHFYWFAGKRLLEMPIKQYVDNRDLGLPFCLCWANENWSRRWDGLDSEILISQEHSPEDDLAFIEYVSRYLRDPRYICIKGKPLLIVYRPNLLPSAKKTAKRWRIWCRENGIGEIYLAYTQSFESVNPKEYGFDGAIEFPPNNTAPPVITSQVIPKDSNYSGVVYDWSIFVERSKKYQKPGYPLFRGVCPSWDNTPRRMENAGVFLGSTPEKYSEWLKNASIETIGRFSDASERLVFVNAWNEWAEGTYLEPDQKYGYAYLQATRDALERITNRLGKRRIVLVAHDAHPHGAQNLILYMAKALVKEFGFNVDMVVLGDGPLLKEYGRYATLHLLYGKDDWNENAKELAAKLFAEGVRSAIANTVVTGLFAKILKEQGFNVVSLVHELPGIIKEYKLQPHIKAIAKHADWIVFPASQVREGFNRFSHIASQRTIIRPQGLFRKNSIRSSGQIETARHDLRKKFNLPETAQIVLCIGYADHRKGIDLFVDIGIKVMQQNTNAYFLWVGHFDSSIESKIRKVIDSSEFSGHFVFPGIDFQSDLYYAGSDIFALTSREDPFPSVVEEALDSSLPVVAFDGAGGFVELLNRGSGLLVRAFDTTAFADALIDLMRSPENAHLLGQSGKNIVENEFSFRRYMFDLLVLVKSPVKRVSVILPNYNYAKYLAERIRSIVNQEYPIYEIVILDDASSDESVRILNNLIPTLNVDCKLIVNESNSGSPFVQWLKGVELVQGDYVWIAEADDLSEPGFLSEVLQPFDDPSIVLSYCQSKQIDSQGKVLSGNYLDYVSDISTTKWLQHYIEEGANEISSCLAIKNTIPNVSAVVFERKALLNSLKNGIEEIKEYHIAGDWQTYLSILKNGKIAFSPEPLNLHRRHHHSVTMGNFNLAQLEEILAVQQSAKKNFQLTEEVVFKALNYSEHLYEQFNLATRDAPILARHPSLAVYLEDCK